MSVKCRHCGMDSDHDRVCSWCNKPLAEDLPPTADQPGSPAAKHAPAELPAPLELKPRPVWQFFALAGLVVVIVCALLQYMALKKALAPPPEPTAWETVKSMTGHFKLQVPAGWKFSTAGSEGTYESVWVKRGPVYLISLNGTGTKGAISDISGAGARLALGGEGGPPPLERRPEGRFHEALGGIEQRKDTHYKEEGEMQPCRFAGQAAAYSVYTTQRKAGMFKVKIKGWRVSCPGTDFGYDIRAEAPAEHWDEFEPIATKLLAGVEFGTR
jgi:hypothetical protein